MSRLLTLKEAALALRCSLRTIERRIENKEIVAYRTGRKVLIEQVELDRYLKRNRAS